MLQCKSMCVCWVSVDCEEPEVKVEQPVTETLQDYKGEEEVNYQNAVSKVYILIEGLKVQLHLLHNIDT